MGLLLGWSILGSSHSIFSTKILECTANFWPTVLYSIFLENWEL
jgi:hypothetical protein